MRNFVVCTFAYGATWESKEPALYEDVPNYVPDEYTSKMTNEVNKEWEAGRYVKADRNQVVGVAAMGIVVKDAKDRMVHDLTRPDQAQYPKNESLRWWDHYRKTTVCFGQAGV